MPAPKRTRADELRERAANRVPESEDSAEAGASEPVESEPPTFERARLTPKWKSLHDSVMNLYNTAEFSCFILGDADTAGSISLAKEACADAWIRLAQRNGTVERWLIAMSTGGEWGGVVMAHVPILISVLAKRGIFPGGALIPNMWDDNNPNGDSPEQTFPGNVTVED